LIASLTAAGILLDALSIKISIETSVNNRHIPGYINVAILLLDQVPDPSWILLYKVLYIDPPVLKNSSSHSANVFNKLTWSRENATEKTRFPAWAWDSHSFE
jgi:hypothetical protein